MPPMLEMRVASLLTFRLLNFSYTGYIYLGEICIFLSVRHLIFVYFQENEEGLELLNLAIAKAGYTGKVRNLWSLIYSKNET